MKKSPMILRVLFGAVLQFGLIGSLAAEPVEPACAGEGLQPNHTSECREYFRCQGGAVRGAYFCPEGLAFSTLARQCLPKDRVPCVRHVCAPHDPLLYAAPATQCRSYYSCRGGAAVELVCPAGSWFDFERQQCSRTAGVCYEPVCTGQTDGQHADTTQGCRRLLECKGGELRSVASAPSASSSSSRCASPRTTAVAFPIASSDRCSGLPNGPHRAPSNEADCRAYIICKNGETQDVVTCPDSLRFDGDKCSPAETTICVDECALRADGFHADVSSGCADYFYCQNHTSLFRTSCSEGAVFDGLMCVSPAFYRCPVMKDDNPCLRKPDGFHRDYRDCRSFYFCSSEKRVFIDSCPPSMVWDGVSSCVPEDEFSCEDPVPWAGCADKASGLYQDRTRGSDCKNYYHCSSDNLRMNFVCPSNQIFNGEECVHSDTYTCPSLEKDSCDFKADGFYQQTTGGCRAYYMCTRGYKSIFLCDVTQVFNGEKCVSAEQYKCPFHSDDCRGKSKGYHQDTRSNCRKYYFCEKDQKLTTLQCSGSKIFNGQGCVSPKDYQCPVSRDGNPCAFRSDGHYTQTGSKCRKYFKCSGYRLISQYSCPVGQIFDGIDSCAARNCSAPAVTCERDGFVMDLPTRCRSYHVCIDKRKTTLQCEASQVFNGQLCVPEDAFPCPDECSQNHCTNTI